MALNRGSINVDWSHRGTLEKGGESNAWKARFFGLRDEHKKLFYFNSEEKQVLKGVIDLPKMKLFEIHQSYTGKPHCFQLVPCRSAPLQKKNKIK